MADAIKAGDLVMVVRSCCTSRVNKPVFIVGEIDSSLAPSDSIPYCSDCGRDVPAEPFAVPESGPVAQPLSWLKKIPPLSELQTSWRSTDENVPA